MHYFKRNIGDYHKKAGRLSMLEHGAYTLLMDACYDRERFPTKDEALDWCKAASVEEVASVRFVLSKFFTLVNGRYVQARVAKEIDAYYEAKKKHWGATLPQSVRCSIQAARNAAKISATPSWLTKDQREDIARVYAESALMTAQTGIPHEVDHIVPLRGKSVCGLHVAWNLRVIPAYQNRQKSNSLEVEQ